MDADIDIESVVKAIQLLPKFSCTDPSLIELEVEDAVKTLDVSKLPKEIQPMAIRYYACHTLLLQLQTDRGTVSETLGLMSQTYGQYKNNCDQYLKALSDLFDRYGINRNRGAVWTVN